MISKLKSLVFFSALAFALSARAEASIKVVATIPDIAWMAKEIGGDKVETKALLRGTENPHFVDAKPDFILTASNADVVCFAGLDLEVGYLPPVLTKSGNAKVQPAGIGYCDVSKSVTVKDKPTGPVDRSMGDVHPGGNPHYFLSPKAMAEGAVEVARVLTAVDAKNAAAYSQGLKAFQAKMEALHTEINQKLEPFRKAQNGKAILIEYHKEYAYFLEEYGILSFGSIEEKPGVPPSAGRLAEIGSQAKAAGVKVALGADYNPEKTLEKFHDISQIPLAIVPTMIQEKGKVKRYEDLQRFIADQLLKALNDTSKK